MTAENNEELRALKCTSCGGDLVRGVRTYYDEEEEDDVEIPIARCIQCGMEYDQHTQEFYSVFADDFTYDIDASVFKLGIKGEIKGVEYEIIGRLRYQDEDEYEKCTWDEWVAISGDGVYHYFVEEDGKVHSYEEYIPDSVDLESHSGHIEFEGKKISKDDAYTGRIVFAEGELPWQPEIGEAALCYDFKKDGVKYSIEQSENEVSITKGERITYGKLIEAFNIEEYREVYNQTVVQRKVYGRKRKIYMTAMLISLVLSVYGCFSSQNIPGVMNEKRVLTQNIPMSDKTGTYYRSQVLYGPFEITEGESLYNVSVGVNESVQKLSRSWQSFRLMLISEKRLAAEGQDRMYNPAFLADLFKKIDAMPEPVESYVISGDFWDEVGRDSDGYWHESDLTADGDFALDEAGKYLFYIEFYNKKPRAVSAVTVRIDKVRGYRYYVIVFFICTILWAVNSVKSRSYNELPFEVADE